MNLVEALKKKIDDALKITIDSVICHVGWFPCKEYNPTT